MRMGGVSCWRQPSADDDHTHALVAEEGHSFPDNLVALFGQSGAQDCSAETAIPDSRYSAISPLVLGWRGKRHLAHLRRLEHF
jgi:hypothetical protein